MLGILRGMEEKFIVLNNYLGLDTIVYIRNGMLFKPKCTAIKEVEFIDNNKEKNLRDRNEPI